MLLLPSEEVVLFPCALHAVGVSHSALHVSMCLCNVCSSISLPHLLAGIFLLSNWLSLEHNVFLETAEWRILRISAKQHRVLLCLLPGLCLHHALNKWQGGVRWHSSDCRLQGGVSAGIAGREHRLCMWAYTVWSSVAGTWLVIHIVLAIGQAASLLASVLMQRSLLQGTNGIPFSNLAAAIYSFIKSSLLQGITRCTFVYRRSKCLDGFVVLLYVWERVGLTKEALMSTEWVIRYIHSVSWGLNLGGN